MGPLPGSPARCSPDWLVGREPRGPAEREAGSAPARPPSCSGTPWAFAPASAAADTGPPGPGRGGATVGGRRRAVSPPPARPQGRGRCQGDGTCSPEGGSAPSAPRASLLPGPRRPSAGGGAKGQRGGGGPPNPPAGQGRDTGGTKTPGTTTAAAAATTGSASPEARPLVGSCHSPGYGPSLLSTDFSLPPRRPAIPLQLWNGSAPSPIGCALGSLALMVSPLYCPIRKVGFRALVPAPKTAGAGPLNRREHLPPDTWPCSGRP